MRCKFKGGREDIQLGNLSYSMGGKASESELCVKVLGRVRTHRTEKGILHQVKLEK